MWNEIEYTLKSEAPLIMHNGRTADPMDTFTKALKQISSKRKKTDADFEEMAHIEFLAGLYMTKDGPCLPQKVIEATIISAAKKLREGQLVKSGLYCPKIALLEYDGPRDAEALWQDERFRFSSLVRVQSARIVRMRPIFEEWQALITLCYEESLVNGDQVNEWVKIAGTQIGFCDWRPRYGRYSVI